MNREPDSSTPVHHIATAHEPVSACGTATSGLPTARGSWQGVTCVDCLATSYTHGLIGTNSSAVCQRELSDSIRGSLMRDDVDCPDCIDVIYGCSATWCMDNTCTFTFLALDGGTLRHPRTHVRNDDCERSPAEVRANNEKLAIAAGIPPEEARRLSEN